MLVPQFEKYYKLIKNPIFLADILKLVIIQYFAIF